MGFVPNGKMPNVFMAVAMDTFDEEICHGRGGIHPMNKQVPSRRLAIAGMNVAYGFQNYDTHGPWPESIVLSR